MTPGPGRTGAARRVLAAHRGPLVAVAVVTFVATVVGALVLPVLAALATAGLRYDLGRVTAAERDLQVRYTVTEPFLGHAQESFDGIDNALRAARSSFPPLLRSVTGPGEYFAQTDPLPLDAEPSKVPASVSLTADPGFASRAHVVEGRAPRAAEGSDGAVEVVVSRPVAQAIGWPVGTERVAGSVTGFTTMRLVGVYAADDPDADAWQQTPSTLGAALRGTSTGGREVLGVAYVAPGSFATIAERSATTGRAWFPLRTDRIDVADRAALADQTRTALGRLTPLPSTETVATRITTSLPALLDASAARDASVATLASALGSGPLVAVLGVQVLIARATVERDRHRWSLLAARGTGRPLAGAIAALLVGVAAVPATVLGAVVAWAVGSVALPPGAGSGSAAVGIAAVSALLPCIAAAVLVPGHRRHPTRRATRHLVEGAVLVLTAVATVVTVRAGIGTATPSGRVDPLAAAVPVLLAATGTVVAVRLLPATLGALVRRARRAPDLPGFFGTVTAARRGGDGTVALAVAVAGIAVALFGSTVGSTLEDGLTQAAKRSVGADVSVEASGIDPDAVAALTRVRGVQATAGVSTNNSAEITTSDGTVTAEVVVADTRRLAAVQRGVVGAATVPTALRSGSSSGVPVVVSSSLARDLGRAPEVGGTRLRPVATVSDETTFTDAARWLLVDERTADEITSTGSVDRVLVRLTPGADTARVERDLRAAVAGVDVRTTASVTAELTADPRLPGVRTVALVAAGLGVVVGAGALVLAGVLAGAVRRERGRLLTTLGLDARRGRLLVAAEAVPTLVAAITTALVVAAATVTVMLPAADLRSFTGGRTRPSVSVDPIVLGATLAVVVAALLVVLAAEVASGTPSRPRGTARQRPDADPPSPAAPPIPTEPTPPTAGPPRPPHGRRAAPPNRRPNRSRP